MPVTAGAINASEARALPYDGVVQVTVDGRQGTGALLYDGRAILTAAHVLEPTDLLDSVSVGLSGSDGTAERQASAYATHPNYDPASNNYDMALLWLGEPAPASISRYQPYRGDDEWGAVVDIVGYGATGTGRRGADESADGVRRAVENRIETDAAALKEILGSEMGWQPISGEQMLLDFDNGDPANDALGILAGQDNLGLGEREGLTAPGDSGGPAMIDGRIAGVAGYIARLSRGDDNPDITDTLDSSYGELAGFQRVSTNQQWIDQLVRSEYPEPPASPDEVRQTVPEGDPDNPYAYFMLEFTGERDTPGQLLSVDYQTEEGTARAGEDFVPTQGTLVLYPDERQALIPVEIIDDETAEPDEVFSLTVTDPIGGSFEDGVESLTAARIITDDDGLMV